MTDGENPECPACGNPGGGDDVLATGQYWCSTEDCPVVSYRGPTVVERREVSSDAE